MISEKTALVSVSNKRGVVDLCRGLAALGFRLLCTGGTADMLRKAQLAVTDVAEWTGFPEILGGRVKTLHPRVHGGLLGRSTAEHGREMERHGLEAIDLLVVNLYPFEATIARSGVTLEEAIEQIDIGGPAMIRSASKNHERVTVLTDPNDYVAVLEELRAHGQTSLSRRRTLACKAFALTAAYDASIASFLERQAVMPDVTPLTPGPLPIDFPEKLTLNLRRERSLRYGENPHQHAAFYRTPWNGHPSLAEASLLQGKELSYNNLLDLDAALALVLDLPGPAAAIIKHMNPCGAAVDHDGVLAAYRAALTGDPMSAFGGITAINREVDRGLATELTSTFLECVIAPAYTDEALTTLGEKSNLRVLRYESGPASPQELVLRSIAGGVLVQTADRDNAEAVAAKPVSHRAPGDDERRILDFAWRVVKHVKSNAIVLARGSAQGALVVGIGAGQMSRVDSVHLAVQKAADRAVGSVMASDAFFPFRDGIDAAARAGVTAVIQPGGSVRDAEVIAAVDEHGMAMLLTHVRHFRH